MNLEETKESIVESPSGEATAQPAEPAVPKEYESRVKKLLERPTVKVEDLSEEAQEMIENLKMLTDDFVDCHDKRAIELDFLADKWIKDELAGKKVSPATKQKMEQLENKFKKIEEEDIKREKKAKEEEELKAEKQRKGEEAEAIKLEKKAKEKEELEAEEKKKEAEEFEKQKPEKKVEAYIDAIYEEGKREVTVKDLQKDLGFTPPKGDFVIGKYNLIEDDYYYEFNIVKTEE